MKITLYLPSRMYIEAKKSKLNLSRMFQDCLASYFKEKGVQIDDEKYRDSPVVLLVRCPHCGGHFTTTSVRTATCKYCHVHFAIFPRRGFSRVVKIVKGTQEDVARLRGVPILQEG